MHLTALFIEEWVLGVIILIGTGLLTSGAQILLKKLKNNEKWKLLFSLRTSLSNILYVVGFKFFMFVVPLNNQVKQWIDGSLYLFATITFLRLLQQSSLIGIEWIVSRTARSKTLDQGFIPLMKNTMTLFIFLTGGIIILRHFNYDVMSLITALGVGSLAIGLASKDTLSNMISGFILIIDRNLKPGDRISLSGIKGNETTGDVIEIGLRSTQIKTGDGNVLIVPNTELVNTKILNLALPTREVLCTTWIRVAYSVPFSKINAICSSVVKDLEKKSKNKPCTNYLSSISEGYQLIQVTFWIGEVKDSKTVLSRFHEELVKRLQKERISLISPVFPQNLS